MPATINLLPRKEFEITLEDGTVIKGQYGTWAFKRFCDKFSLSPKQAEERLNQSGVGDLSEYLLCAVEHTARKNKTPFSYSDIHSCEWIDQLGGPNSDGFTKLLLHAADDLAKEEKKTEDIPT